MGILLYATGTGAAERTLTLLRYSTSHENRRYVDTVVFGSVCMWRARVHWMRSSRLPCSRLLATLQRSPCSSALEQRPAQDLMLSCHLVIIVSVREAMPASSEDRRLPPPWLLTPPAYMAPPSTPAMRSDIEPSVRLK